MSGKRKRRLSLKKAAVLTISLGALILTSVGAGLLGLWGQRGVFWETQQLLLQNDQAVLGRVIREVDTTLTDHAEGLTRHSDLVKAFAQRQVEILEEYAVPVFNRLSKQGLLSRLRFFTSEGRLFFEAHGDTAGGDTWHLVQEVLSQKKRVARLELDQGEPVLSVALPVYAQGELVGVLQAGLGLRKIVHMLRGILGSQVGLFTIGGEEEVTLQSATDAELLTALARLLPLKGRRAQAVRETRHLGGLTYAVSLLPLEAEPGRSVGILLSATDVTALGQAMTRTAVLVGVATLIGILVASLVTSISLIRRLRPLGQTVDLLEDIAQGEADLTRRLPVEVQDEIGSLAMSANRMMEWMEEMVTVADRIGGGDLTVRVTPRSDRDVMGQALNRMVEQLQKLPEAQERAQEQAALNAIAMATSQSLHLNELLQIALNKVLEITGRERGYILLKDQATGEFTLAGHRGISQEYTDTLLRHRTPGGKSDQVFESGEPLVINDPEGTILREETRRQGNTSIGWFPLKARGKVVGILNVSTARPILFTLRETQILQTIGNIIGVALENVRLFEQTQRNLERIQALREIDQAITSTLDLHDVLDVLLEKIDILLPYSAATVRLLNKQTGNIEPVACRKLDEEEWKAEQWRSGRGTPNVVFESKAPWMVRNVQTDPRVRDPEFFRKRGLVSYLGVPLIVKDVISGVLSVYTKEEHQFSNEEIEFLTTLAGQAAIAIHNSQLYEETRKQAVELERANKVKDEFLGFVSHELRTPANAVIGYAGLIRDKMLGEINQEQEKTLGKVISCSEDLLGMINGLLEATRIEAGAVKVESREVGLGHFLDELRSGYDIPLGKELSLSWDYPPALPVIRTDSGKLRHILQNLINNAIKFTDKGSVSISARLTPHAARLTPRWVEFKVADTGIGIPKESLPTIFEMFRQVEGSKNGSRGGVGLGLYIVKKFAEMLGGEIDVESEPRKGSTFTVTIPYELENK